MRQSKWLLSGGIGSGKSEVGRMLARHGVNVIDADSVGHEVLAPGGAAADEVAAAWPSVVRDGVVDRGALAAVVFSDPEELHRLETITHPHIFAGIEERLGEGHNVAEIPLLTQPFDPPWPRMVVDARDELRMERAVLRGMDPGDVQRRMESQPSRGEWLAGADLVIPNNGDFDDLESAVAMVVEVVFSGSAGHRISPG